VASGPGTGVRGGTDRSSGVQPRFLVGEGQRTFRPAIPALLLSCSAYRATGSSGWTALVGVGDCFGPDNVCGDRDARGWDRSHPRVGAI
jgi:hypothetical protein